MLGMAAFMDWRGGLKTAHGTFWFAVGGILGWPFSIALAAPFLLEEVIFAAIGGKTAFVDTVIRFVRGAIAGLSVLVGLSHSENLIKSKRLCQIRHSNS